MTSGAKRVRSWMLVHDFGGEEREVMVAVHDLGGEEREVTILVHDLGGRGS